MVLLCTMFSAPWHMVIALSLLQMACSQQALTMEHDSQILPNNSLLVLTEIGEAVPTTLQCLTTRSDCCLAEFDDGEWILPSGAALENLTSTLENVGFYSQQVAGGIDLLRRNDTTSPEGLYRCEIARNSSTDSTDVVYIGLYLDGNGRPGTHST